MPIETRTRVVYNPGACLPAVYGCTAPDAINYDPSATINNGTCIWGSDPRGPENFSKNDCQTGTGGQVAFSVPLNWRTSGANKAGANLNRDDDFDEAGQALANLVGGCGGTDPLWQFNGTVLCLTNAPRTSSGTQSRMQDLNPSSPTYTRWRKLDGTTAETEGGGDFYPTGLENPNLCPIQGLVQVFLVYKNNLDATVAFPSGQVPRVSATYQFNGATSSTSFTSYTEIYTDYNSPITLSAGIQQGESLMQFDRFITNGSTTVLTNPLSGNSGSGFSVEVIYKAR